MKIVDSTTPIDPFSVDIDLEQGIMHKATKHIVRRAADMKGYYRDERALERLALTQGNPLHYEVFEVPVPQEYGHLMYGISTLQPGLVGEECYMTKGHFHAICHTGEVYLCLRGDGYMMMKTSDGHCRWEPMSRGKMVYVSPYWAHRSINTGQEPLVSFCVYPADAGHNYGDIAEVGFPKRVFVRNGQVVIE